MMKNKAIPFIAALMLSIPLAGCSALMNQNHLDDALQPAITTPLVAEPTTMQENPAQTAEAVVEPTASIEPAAEKLYAMNHVYRFIPLNDHAESKAVLLTFDDGPKDQTIIESMLDTLDKHKAKAIFFVNGYRVQQNPDLLKLIHDRGQTIGNHSWDHINLKNEPEDIIEEQIGKLQTKIEDLIGKKPEFFRPPFGAGGDTVKQIAKNHGMLFMTWSNGSLDWDKAAKDKPEFVIQNVMEQLHPGANILMHELQWTADALDELLRKLEAEGYRFIDPDSIEITD